MYRRPHGTPWAQGQSLAGADGPGWMVDGGRAVRCSVQTHALFINIGDNHNA